MCILNAAFDKIKLLSFTLSQFCIFVNISAIELEVDYLVTEKLTLKIVRIYVIPEF